jgi:hypothetical protein
VTTLAAITLWQALNLDKVCALYLLNDQLSNAITDLNREISAGGVVKVYGNLTAIPGINGAWSV